MADITRVELIDMVLQHLVVLGVGQTASAEDADFVGRAIDSAHDRLNKFGLVPFTLVAIPAWAQIPMRDIVAIDVSPSFGREVQRLPGGSSPIQEQAKAELARQVAGYRHDRRTRATYY